MDFRDMSLLCLPEVKSRSHRLGSVTPCINKSQTFALPVLRNFVLMWASIVLFPVIIQEINFVVFSLNGICSMWRMCTVAWKHLTNFHLRTTALFRNSDTTFHDKKHVAYQVLHVNSNHHHWNTYKLFYKHPCIWSNPNTQYSGMLFTLSDCIFIPWLLTFIHEKGSRSDIANPSEDQVQLIFSNTHLSRDTILADNLTFLCVTQLGSTRDQCNISIWASTEIEFIGSSVTTA